jgi:hypothetical protein
VTCADCDGAGCAECALPRRGSGTPSEAYYAARGYQRLQVRLPLDSLDLLDRLVEAVSDEEERRDQGEPEASRAVVLDTVIRYMTEIEQREPGELAAAIRLRRG